MKRIFTRVLKACGAVALFFLASPESTTAQVSMGRFITTYSQNFNGLPASGTGTWDDGQYYFPGWTVKRTVASSTITANSGGSNTSGLYSYGSTGTSDRALGSISSIPSGLKVSAQFAYGLLLQNNAGTSITSLDISFFGEQWRVSNSTAPEHKLVFSYAISDDPSSFNLSPANTNWTVVPALEFRSPKYKVSGGALDGNLPENKRFLTASLPIVIPNGHYIMLRWVDYDETEADHGLAIDDVSLAWSVNPSGPGILPVELVQFSATKLQKAVELHWRTASEDNNDHFAVERSRDGKLFEEIGRVAGKGNSKVLSTYTFTDNKPFGSTSYYRLKQVDTDGTFAYSNAVAVEMSYTSETVKVYPTLTADFLQVELNHQQRSSKLMVVDEQGKLVLERVLSETQSINQVDVRQLHSGMYVLILQTGKETVATSRFVKL
ncbi:T9SS type A sorting domain-containing protein [Pontibacter ruber]|uniref:T9SS type A sorting domain-containing protein n=1 Tax=Pontibacter ruber TaxID=1343895 RepID=A0ABW5CWN9_9BACT|nr:T9SS type A sorting domain-containing protein [Pontibacter ruber]